MLPRRTLCRAVSLAAFVLLAFTLAAAAQSADRRGRKYKSPPPTTKLEVTVVRDVNGKPIENAAIIFHTLNDPGNMELKSNEDGKTLIDVLPIGETVRLQIIAKGFQTYGGDYKIDKDQMALEIRMKRPGEQYSIYKAHADDEKDQKAKQSKSDKSKDSEKKDADKPGEPKTN